MLADDGSAHPSLTCPAPARRWWAVQPRARLATHHYGDQVVGRCTPPVSTLVMAGSLYDSLATSGCKASCMQWQWRLVLLTSVRTALSGTRLLAYGPLAFRPLRVGSLIAPSCSTHPFDTPCKHISSHPPMTSSSVHYTTRTRLMHSPRFSNCSCYLPFATR